MILLCNAKISLEPSHCGAPATMFVRWPDSSMSCWCDRCAQSRMDYLKSATYRGRYCLLTEEEAVAWASVIGVMTA